MSTFPFRGTAFVGITVDGFVARSNGLIDYLPPAPATEPHQHPVCGVPTVSDMLGMITLTALPTTPLAILVRLSD
jgi:hypothetical protein